MAGDESHREVVRDSYIDIGGSYEQEADNDLSEYDGAVFPGIDICCERTGPNQRNDHLPERGYVRSERLGWEDDRCSYGFDRHEDKRGLFGLEKEHLGSAVLIPGLKVSVEGSRDGGGRVVANKITVDGDDLETAEMIQAGLNPTAQQVATNMQGIQKNQQGVAANQKGVATNQKGVAANQQNITETPSRLQPT